MIKKLRPYQKNIVEAILKKLKESDEPILIDASVGSGKSLILSFVLLVLERAGFPALCLTLNSTLIKQNSDTYQSQGGNCSIYAASWDSKCCKNLIIFASPNSICQGIRNKQEVSTKPFKLIVIDEVHNLNFQNTSSMYMRIISHYSLLAQQEQYKFKIIGLSGTCYRNKNESIVGPNQFFKSKLCEVSTPWLIDNGYLTKPEFGITKNESFQFKNLKVDSKGKFNGKELESTIKKQFRLTGQIMQELQELDFFGCFVFASSISHCYECLDALPKNQSAIIIGATSTKERQEILAKAAKGEIRFLISVSCLLTGIDCPPYDAIAWLRPTESLNIYVQGIGRVLRLHPGKTKAIILDYAQNLDRHGHIDDPIINQANKPKPEEEAEYVIPCYDCSCLNKITARRCIGMPNNKRCEHYFEFKDCANCKEANDITSRCCRHCDAELIDPNAKLKKIRETYNISVTSAEYWITPQGVTSNPIINVKYITNDKDIFECYYTNTEKAKNVCYAKFIRQHIPSPSDYYLHLQNLEKMRTMLLGEVLTPHTLVCTKDDYGRFQVLKKVFN